MPLTFFTAVRKAQTVIVTEEKEECPAANGGLSLKIVTICTPSTRQVLYFSKFYNPEISSRVFHVQLPDYAVCNNDTKIKTSAIDNSKKGMILPFQPLTMTFHNLNYYVDMPKVYSLNFIIF